MKINIRTIMAWAVKLGTLGFNLPATMGVALLVVELVSKTTFDKFDTAEKVLAYILIISGIIVVDSVFIASWYDLDNNKTQDDSDKLADAITVVIMYVLTIVIGLVHGEGVPGVTFRIPMGIAVARSTWKTLSYSVRRSSEGSKAGVPLQVRWEQMKAIAAKGIAAIQFDLTNYIEELAAQLEVIRAHRNAKKQAGVDIVVDMQPIYREQAVASAKSNNVSMTQLPSLTTATKTPISTILPASQGNVQTNTNKTSGNYSIHYDGKEWIATCLHPGCSVVKSGDTELGVKRQIVGHGNAHKTRDSKIETIDNTVVEKSELPEVVEEVIPTVYVEVPEETHQIADDPSSRFQPPNNNTGEF